MLKNNSKIDLNRWFNNNYDKPMRRGKYLTTVGVYNKSYGCQQTGIIESYWDGKKWCVPEHYNVYKWKYTRPGEIDKYADFEGCLRYEKRMINSEYNMVDDRSEASV